MEGGVLVAEYFPLAIRLTQCPTMTDPPHSGGSFVQMKDKLMISLCGSGEIKYFLNKRPFIFCVLAEIWGNCVGRNLFVALIFSKTSRAVYFVDQLLFANGYICKKIKHLVIHHMHIPSQKAHLRNAIVFSDRQWGLFIVIFSLLFPNALLSYLSENILTKGKKKNPITI